MAYDEAVAERIRQVLKQKKGITERQMFGGIAFMLNGNMICGVLKSELMLRLGEEQADEALSEPHTRIMNFTGKPMKSMIIVDTPGYKSDKALRDWLQRALTFVKTLPAK